MKTKILKNKRWHGIFFSASVWYISICIRIPDSFGSRPCPAALDRHGHLGAYCLEHRLPGRPRSMPRSWAASWRSTWKCPWRWRPSWPRSPWRAESTRRRRPWPPRTRPHACWPSRSCCRRGRWRCSDSPDAVAPWPRSAPSGTTPCWWYRRRQWPPGRLGSTWAPASGSAPGPLCPRSRTWPWCRRWSPFVWGRRRQWCSPGTRGIDPWQSAAPSSTCPPRTRRAELAWIDRPCWLRSRYFHRSVSAMTSLCMICYLVREEVNVRQVILKRLLFLMLFELF